MAHSQLAAYVTDNADGSTEVHIVQKGGAA